MPGFQRFDYNRYVKSTPDMEYNPNIEYNPYIDEHGNLRKFTTLPGERPPPPAPGYALVVHYYVDPTNPYIYYHPQTFQPIFIGAAANALELLYQPEYTGFEMTEWMGPV